MDETEKIKSRDAERETGDTYRFPGPDFYFNFFMTKERELNYAEILRQYFTDTENIRLIEIVYGSNLSFFPRIGIPRTNLYANELLYNRFEKLKDNFPHVLTGSNTQDIVSSFHGLLNKKARFIKKYFGEGKAGKLVVKQILEQ